MVYSLWFKTDLKSLSGKSSGNAPQSSNKKSSFTLKWKFTNYELTTTLNMLGVYDRRIEYTLVITVSGPLGMRKTLCYNRTTVYLL